MFNPIFHNDCNFRPLNCINKAHLKVVALNSLKISCKYPYLINSEFANIEARDLTNMEWNWRSEFCR